MADYHKMYLHLFNEMTRAIQILQEAQQHAEEMYISGKDVPLHLGVQTSLAEEPERK